MREASNVYETQATLELDKANKIALDGYVAGPRAGYHVARAQAYATLALAAATTEADHV